MLFSRTSALSEEGRCCRQWRQARGPLVAQTARNRPAQPCTLRRSTRPETRMVERDHVRLSSCALAAGQRWGTRGRGVKSHRPDRRKALHPLGFPLPKAPSPPGGGAHSVPTRRDGAEGCRGEGRCGGGTSRRGTTTQDERRGRRQPAPYPPTITGRQPTAPPAAAEKEAPCRPLRARAAASAKLSSVVAL
jgi:hypothetical protein